MEGTKKRSTSEDSLRVAPPLSLSTGLPIPEPPVRKPYKNCMDFVGRDLAPDSAPMVQTKRFVSAALGLVMVTGMVMGEGSVLEHRRPSKSFESY